MVLKAEYDSKYHKDRRAARKAEGVCAICPAAALKVGKRTYTYCRGCGSHIVRNQRKRLGQQPRSKSRGGRRSVYLYPEYQ